MNPVGLGSSLFVVTCWFGDSVIHWFISHLLCLLSARQCPWPVLMGGRPERSALGWGIALRKALDGKNGDWQNDCTILCSTTFCLFKRGQMSPLRPSSFHIYKIGLVVPALKIVVLILKILYFYKILKGLYLKTSSLFYSFPSSILLLSILSVPSGDISKLIVLFLCLLTRLC